jgi:type IV secretion system protein VirB11
MMDRDYALHLFRKGIEPLMELAGRYDDPEEVIVDGAFDGDKLLVETGEGLVPHDMRKAGLDLQRVRALADLAATYDGAVFGELPPAKASLSCLVPPDLRITANIYPVVGKISFNMRFLRARSLTLNDYVNRGTMTQEQADRLRHHLDPPWPQEKANVIISGSTGSGKTTLLRAILRELADRERILICEDTQELSLDGFDVVNMRTVPTQGVELGDVIAQAMRMRPDRIVIGEIRDKAAEAAIRGMNSGHPGTLLTLHSNGRHAALEKLHQLASMSNQLIPFSWVREAVDVVVQIAGKGPHRRVREIWEVEGDR